MAILLLRFRCITPTATVQKYFSYSTISKVLNIAYNSVQHICRHAMKPPNLLKPIKEARKLTQDHIKFLTSYSTLEKWAGQTLEWRTKLFHRKFPDKRIAVTTLRRLYLKHGIKRKKVRQEKYMPLHSRQQFQ